MLDRLVRVEMQVEDGDVRGFRPGRVGLQRVGNVSAEKAGAADDGDVAEIGV